ncbi:MAG: DNA primase small subunit domain-containing protein [archaeon]
MEDNIEAISARLNYYKRRDIQEAIIACAENREVAFRYTDKFGQRPDILAYPREIIELVKKGVTSFHISEEQWHDIMLLSPSLKKEELNELRKGWDLVLDIDCPFWDFSKLTAHLFIKAIKEHGINSVSCKFSGNKGFHIGVPYEAFPSVIKGTPLNEAFPDAPRKIAEYLLDYIAQKYVEESNGKIIFDSKYEYTLEQFAKELSLNLNELTFKSKCKKCGKEMVNAYVTEFEYICTKCETRIVEKEEKKFTLCPKCNSLMERFKNIKTKCEKCGGTVFEDIRQFNPFSVVKIDTILIASRHLFRSPYSLHEKSGFASVPILPEKIMSFEKKMAHPSTVSTEFKFLERANVRKNEALELITSAYEFKLDITDEKKSLFGDNSEVELLGTEIPVVYFPPCMLKILEGLEDGKKRSLFTLMNFLTCVGYNHLKIKEILTEWNKKNKEPLRDISILGQVRYHEQKKKLILPPNCRSYYEDFRVCSPDSLCEIIKNPVSYSKRKARDLLLKGKKDKPRLSDEQKEMRRTYREKLKREAKIE